jgi:hypothetical protein
MSTSVFDRQIVDVASRVCEGLGSPLALSAFGRMMEGDWDGLAAMRVDPSKYFDPESYWRDATAVGFLRKLESLPTSHDRKAKAVKSFLDSEEKCFRTNLRLLPYLSPGLPDTAPGICDFLSRVRKIAERILGQCPSEVEGRFGPGATFADRVPLTTVPDKMSSKPTLTTSAWPFMITWMATKWHDAAKSRGDTPLFVEGNRFFTVPKDSEKYRGACSEPSLNLFYQLGYGRAMRSRLKRSGIDLIKGKEIHMRVAREASVTSSLATLDLSNASDTISMSLVKLILPARWYEALVRLRSPKTLIAGRWHVLEKFSSMGNGFTFELETLIFLCLALAVPSQEELIAGRNVFVYGDDIIVPSAIAKDVISVLSFFGLSINKEKSFIDGWFRESCGGDYFMGVDVRPFFLEELPDGPQGLISIANGLRRACKGNPLARWPLLRHAWFRVLDSVPSSIRGCRGPEGLGDLVVHDSEESWRPRWRSGIRYFRVWRPSRYREVAWSHWKPDVILASALYGVSSGTQVDHVRDRHEQTRERLRSGGVIPRDSVLSYKLGWVSYS